MRPNFPQPDLAIRITRQVALSISSFAAGAGASVAHFGGRPRRFPPTFCNAIPGHSSRHRRCDELTRPVTVYNLTDVHLPRLRSAGSPLLQRHPARQGHRAKRSVRRLWIQSPDHVEGKAQPVGASWDRQGRAEEGCITGTWELTSLIVMPHWLLFDDLWGIRERERSAVREVRMYNTLVLGAS